MSKNKLSSDEKMNNLVAKSNTLVDAFYTLSLNEHRLIAYAISCIERNDIPRNDNLEVSIKLAEFKSFFGVADLKVSELQASIKRLYDRSIHIYDEEKGRRVRFRWLGEVAEYSKKTDDISIVFYKRVVPHLTGLKDKGHYTRYFLEVAKDFKCKHTFPVWEMLAKTRNMRRDIHTIRIADLREKLELEGSYKAFKDFNKYVIKPVFKDLNECMLLAVDYELIKKGRSYTAIQVVFKEAPEAIPPRNKKAKPKLPAKAPAKNARNSQAEKPAPIQKRKTKTGSEIKTAKAAIENIKEGLGERCPDTKDFINEKVDAEINPVWY